MFKKYDEFVKQAEELQDYIDTKFRNEVLFKGFVDSVLGDSIVNTSEVIEIL